MSDPSAPAPTHHQERNMIPFWVAIAVAVTLIAIQIISAVQGPAPKADVSQLGQGLNDSLQRAMQSGSLRVVPIVTMSFAVLGLLLAGCAVLILCFVRICMRRPLIAQSPSWQPLSWGLRDVVAVTVMVIVVTTGLTFILPISREAAAGPKLWVRELAWRTVLAVGIITLVVRVRGGTMGALGLHRQRILRNIGLGILAFASLFAIGAAIMVCETTLLRHLGLKLPVQETVELARQMRSPWSFGAMAALAVVLAPFTEELFFRAFLQGALREVCGSGPAIVATAMLFGAVHMNIYWFPSLFVLGLVLGYVYDRTQSLAAPIALHVCQNGFTMAVLLAIRVLEH
jgi:membrane protease YdiL (CAAX protease family)